MLQRLLRWPAMAAEEPRADTQLMHKIVVDLRAKWPETVSCWEIIHYYGGTIHSDDTVRASLDLAIENGDLIEDDDGVYFNFYP
jgi:hypothetical protein